MPAATGPLVVLTRADNTSMRAALEARGARCIDYPCIAHQPLATTVSGDYTWVVFTSPRAVQYTDLSQVRAEHIASVGRATTAALQRKGLNVDLSPDPHHQDAEGLLQVFPRGDGAVLLPRSAKGRAVLPKGLRAKGWEVTDHATYTTVLGPGGTEPIDGADVVCFTSPSTVQGFLTLAGAPPAGAKIASIGPVTTRTLARAGIVVDIQPPVAEVPALVDTVIRHFQGE